MSNNILPDGIICTTDEYQQSSVTLMDPNRVGPALYCLTRGQSIGLAFSVQAGVLSVIAVLVLFLLICRNAWRSRGRNWQLVQKPVDLYVLCLFVCDLIQAVGGMINAKWVTEGKVYTGGFCTFQGAIQQIGETGVALFTLVITLQTFWGVWWSKGSHDALVSYLVTGSIFLFIVLFVGISVGIHTHPSSKYYDLPTPYWCWIGGAYGKERIAGEYFWMWLTMSASISLYVPLYFLYRRNITVDEKVWWKFDVHRRKRDGDDTAPDAHPLVMLAYPAVYCLTVLPTCIARWVQFYRENHDSTVATPSAATFFTEFLYRSSGLVNIILYLSTRGELLSLGVSSGLVKAPSQMSLPLKDDGENGTAHVEVTVVEADAERAQQRPVRVNRRPTAPPRGLGALDEEGWDLADGEDGVRLSTLANRGATR